MWCWKVLLPGKVLRSPWASAEPDSLSSPGSVCPTFPKGCSASFIPNEMLIKGVSFLFGCHVSVIKQVLTLPMCSVPFVLYRETEMEAEREKRGQTQNEMIIEVGQNHLRPSSPIINPSLPAHHINNCISRGEPRSFHLMLPINLDSFTQNAPLTSLISCTLLRRGRRKEESRVHTGTPLPFAKIPPSMTVTRQYFVTQKIPPKSTCLPFKDKGSISKTASPLILKNLSAITSLFSRLEFS